MSKRILAILLSGLMAFSVMPTAFAEETETNSETESSVAEEVVEEEPTVEPTEVPTAEPTVTPTVELTEKSDEESSEVSTNEETITIEDKDEAIENNASIVKSDDNDGTWDYDESTSTLTLTNYVGDTTQDNIQIYLEEDTTIILNGNNTLTAESDYGIYCEGNLTLSGNGSLYITGASTSIYATKGIKVTDAKIEADAGIVSNWGDFVSTNATIALSGDIITKNTHDIVIQGGSVKVGCGLNTTNVTIKNSSLTGGIESTGKVIMVDSAVNTNQQSIIAGRLEMSGGSIDQAESIVVSSYNIEGAIITSDTESNILETKISEYGSPFNADSYLKDCVVTAPNATIKYNNYQEVAAEIVDSLITVDAFTLMFEDTSTPLTIGENTIVNVNRFYHGWDNRLIINGGELNVKGDIDLSDNIHTEILEVNSGKLNVDGNVNIANDGSYNDRDTGSVIINGGDVKITGSVDVDYMTITGGTISVKNGVNANEFIFRQGTFEAFNSSQAIIANTYEISGNIKTGKTAEKAVSATEYQGEKYVWLNHTHNYEESITKKATCRQKGEKSYICSDCGDSYTETIDKIEHNYKTITDPATLSEFMSSSGCIETKCTMCGYVSKTVCIPYIDPLSIALVYTRYAYSGSTKTPTVIVKDYNGNALKKDTDYTVSYSSNRKSVGKYKVTVKFKGNYSGTKELTFKIVPKGTTLSSVSASSKAFTAKWNLQKTQTTGYQIEYSTSSKFSSGNKYKTITKNTSSSLKVTGLKAKTKYYVRVRTYKLVNGTKVYSSWSSTKSVTTK